MKLCVLALDYDGTIAHNDRPEASVLDAIAAARGRGIKVLLVSGHTTTLAPPVPAAFVAALLERGIAFQAGQCLIDAGAGSASRMLDIIHNLRLPIVLLFNRSRVMALPQASDPDTTWPRRRRMTRAAVSVCQPLSDTALRCACRS